MQDGRKPNRNRKNGTGISETEPVAVYHETGETGNWRNRNGGLQKVVPLHRPEVGQIKSCGRLSTTIRKRSARSTKWAWFQCLDFPMGLEKAGFLVLWFLQLPVLNQLQRKQNKQTRPSLEFRIRRLQENARIQKYWKIIKKKQETEERENTERGEERGGVEGPRGPKGPGAPLLSFPLSF